MQGREFSIMADGSDKYRQNRVHLKKKKKKKKNSQTKMQF